MKATHFRQSLSLLFSGRFGMFWFATLLANIGTWAQQMAQPWLMLSLGASPFLLGLDSFAMGAPVMLLTLVGGSLADRGDRRRIIALFQSIQMMCPVLLVVLIVAHVVQPWVVIGLSLVVGITDALSMPSFQSIVPSIVEKEQIPAGIALNSTQFNLSRILGPALAGILIANMGMAGAFALSAASYLPFILVALWVLPRFAPSRPSDRLLDSQQLWANVREVIQDRNLRGALLTVFITGALCAPLITFTPVLVKEVFHGGAGQFSAALGAFGIGGLLGASGLLAIDPQRDRRPISTFFALIYGVVVIGASLNPWEWGLPVLLVFAGIGMTASNASANALLQSNAPARIRGQTVSLFMLSMRGSMALGSLMSGMTVHLMGVREAMLLNGALAILAQAIVSRQWWVAPYRMPQQG